MGIGEYFALGAALMWTASSMLWGRIQLSALGMNLCKNIIATLFLIVHVIMFAWVTGADAFCAPLESWGWLGLSGVIGIVVGDTVYFRSLQILGPRLSLLIATTAPLFSAFLGWSMLGEGLKWFSLLGIVMTISGVVFVVADRKSKQESPGLYPGHPAVGIMLGVFGAVCQAVGGVYAKMGMEGADGVDLCHPIEASLIRIGIAAVITVVVVLCKRQLLEITRKAVRWETLRILIPAAAIGTWLGIWFSQAAYKYTDNIAIAQTLLGTCPLFAIPIVYWVDGHRISVWSLVGTLVAILGIFLVVTKDVNFIYLLFANLNGIN